VIRAAIYATVVLAAAAAFTAGCSAAPSRESTGHGSSGKPAPSRSAVADAQQRVHCAAPWQRPSALPARFVAAGAVLCTPTLALANRSGQAGFTEQVADRGLAPLVAALLLPSSRLPPGVVCASDLVAVPVLFLIDRSGQIVRPVIPADGCGQPLSQVLNALHHVPWVTP
jgi:hypothetical protein